MVYNDIIWAYIVDEDLHIFFHQSCPVVDEEALQPSLFLVAQELCALFFKNVDMAYNDIYFIWYHYKAHFMTMQFWVVLKMGILRTTHFPFLGVAISHFNFSFLVMY